MTEKTRAKVPRLTRGVIAARTGVNIETVRYYERIGLLPEPPRSEGGHRLYTEDLLRRLNFIRRCRELGFPVQEVRALLSLVDGGDYSCGEVRELTLRHLEDVRAKIADLRRLERTLAEVSSQCEGGAVPDCPIIDALLESRL